MIPATSPDFFGSDRLTHTTLETDDGLSVLTVTGLLRALRDVPGVLLADVAAGSRYAVVAHDAAVPSASLPAAARGAGVHARIRGANRSPSKRTVAASLVSINGLLFIIVEVLVLFAVVYVINPRLFGMRSFLSIALASVWGCVLAHAILGRRK